MEYNLNKIMKNIPCCLTAAGVSLMIGSAAVQAQYQIPPPSPYQYAPYYQTTPFYLNADIGGSLEQSIDLKNLGTRVGFNPGTSFDVSFGYNIVPQVAVEFETGVIWNSLSGSGPQIISPVADRADLYQVPFLGNIVFKLPLQCGITPYIGGGVGGVASTLVLSRGSSNSSWGHISDTDFTFAYQGMAGLKFALNQTMEVGVGYKFLGTLDHQWFGNDPNLVVNTSPTYSHSILASFTWHF